MTATGRFRVRKNVIHQTLDNETVIINLDNGRYYSLNPMGSTVWDLMAAHHSLADITAMFEVTQPAETETIANALGEFVEALQAQELIMAELSCNNAPSVPPASSDAPRLRFAKPQLEVFTDMENLLPIDPIHEVDERGWPYRDANDS